MGDVQVIVTVRGRDGQPVSSAPPVKLEIVSGPGEFPTGRTIEFAADSDIAIRDGEAAIELRAYQSGTIRLLASSPGLKDAGLAVKAVGGPAFAPGVTPVVGARPYVELTEGGPALDVSVDLSLNRPTDASSSTVGIAAGWPTMATRRRFGLRCERAGIVAGGLRRAVPVTEGQADVCWGRDAELCN